MTESTRRMQFTDSGFAWIVTAMSFFVLYAVNSNFISLGPLLPDLLSHFQVSQAMLGMLASVRIVICDAASGTLVGPLVRKLGCRPLVMVGLALSAAGYVAAAFVDDYYIFLLMFSVIPGLGLAGAYIPSNVIVHQYHSKGRALASGLSSVGLSFSTFTFPVLMRLTIRSFGWRASLVMLAAIQVQMVAAAMIFMPNPDLKMTLNLETRVMRTVAKRERLRPYHSLKPVRIRDAVERLSGPLKTADDVVDLEPQSSAKFACRYNKLLPKDRLYSFSGLLQTASRTSPLSDNAASHHISPSFEELEGLSAFGRDRLWVQKVQQ
ncbi:hypothetical protein CAPTEDRAFT_196761 [Capitella teleta]|uniref:Major facilitator superfamily (MFS) profile domain-containing protein n=1 Tax=Capitella teleta TaxID=283909 RepID=R7UR97_CAPTE|nr:hypothetical protein CAPTEDRAFT_196761 [Capitella teleta]|eukprot:ELU05941.1 hypothetical protein CAPTEDRAFT_196761 [Capitella teleta]